jgi:hypothetical protein
LRATIRLRDAEILLFGMVGVAQLYEVLDPRPNAALAPYTLFLRDPELIKAIRKGDRVNAIIRVVRRAKSTARSAHGYGLLPPSLIGSEAHWKPHDKPELAHGANLRRLRSRVVEAVLGDPRARHSSTSIGQFPWLKRDQYGRGLRTSPEGTHDPCPARCDGSATMVACRRHILLCALSDVVRSD